MADKTLRQYQKDIDDWAQTLEKPYWSPLSIYVRLVEEVGELGRLLNHLYGDKPKKTSEATQELAEEMADVIFSLICQANREGIDLDPALQKAIKKSKTRDRNRFAKKASLKK
jgi:NTP pyrophosphatase (non-canonical NTP hydrolase)